MSSWRDNVSQQAQDDLDELLNASLPFAQKMLGKHGEFFPYAFVIGTDGEIRMVAGDPNLGEQPPSAAILASITEGLRSERDTIRAAALVSDVRLVDTDAIRVETEHVEGQAIEALLPYKTSRLRRTVKYGSLMASQSDPQIWASH
ncbi:MAG: hypothetical protein QNJ75_05390 [Acidimicrobiia bacterium]|nr:hypothetical protein [Acidimicrobiia bacterium]